MDATQFKVPTYNRPDDIKDELFLWITIENVTKLEAFDSEIKSHNCIHNCIRYIIWGKNSKEFDSQFLS